MFPPQLFKLELFHNYMHTVICLVAFVIVLLAEQTGAPVTRELRSADVPDGRDESIRMIAC